MGLRHILCGLCVAAAASATARAGLLPPQEDCASAAGQAERRWALPQGLLLAIGLAETGTRNPVTAQLEPASYAVNVAGSAVAFSAASYAVDAVAALRRRGIASIDVGCFQINLQQHPSAFRSLSQGFEPLANADYAAGFLRDLFTRTGDWRAAVAAYHSADPRRGLPYRDRVLQFWNRTGHALGGPVAAPAREAVFDAHVILASAAASRIRVFTPVTLPPRLRANLGLYTKP